MIKNCNSAYNNYNKYSNPSNKKVVNINFKANSKKQNYVSTLNSNSMMSKNCKLKDVADFIITMMKEKHPATADHMIATSIYAKALANAINLPKKKVDKIATGALLHDTGKIFVDSEYFLDENCIGEKVKRCRQHPTLGAKLLNKITPFKGTVTQIADLHHERLKGGGYPKGIKGDKIPLETQITTVADAFDSLSRKKYPFIPPKAVKKTLEILKKDTRGKFNPALVDVFCNIVKKNNFELYRKTHDLEFVRRGYFT